MLLGRKDTRTKVWARRLIPIAPKAERRHCRCRLPPTAIVIGYRVWILWCRALQVRCDGGDGRAQEVGDHGMGVKPALCGGADEGGEDLLGVCAPPGAIAAADFTDDDSGTDGLFSAPVGSIDGGVA